METGGYTLLGVLQTSDLILIGVIGVFVVLLVAGVPLLYAKLYQKVSTGQALIINKMQRVEVFFTGGLCVPVVHRMEVMDISVKTLEIDRRGKDGVICRDDIRADLKATFFVRVNKTAEDVIQVATAIGATRASDQITLEELFVARFSEAIKTVAKQLDFEELYTKRSEFKDRILEVIGFDLDGYVLDDVAIDFLEQTPIDALDKNNILDARGIRKIAEITAEQERITNEIRRRQHEQRAKYEIEVKELLVEIERRQADALAKLRADTGRQLTLEQLEERLDDRLRQMVDVAVEERLGREA